MEIMFMFKKNAKHSSKMAAFAIDLLALYCLFSYLDLTG